MRKERKENLAYILAFFFFFLNNWPDFLISCFFKGISLFVSFVSLDYDK